MAPAMAPFRARGHYEVDGTAMSGVAPWLTATVFFADVERLPRDLRLEVRVAGRLVSPQWYDIVASYALPYPQAARGTVALLEELFAGHQNVDHPWNPRPRRLWHARPMSIGDLIALTLSDDPPTWWVCEATGFRMLREDEEGPFTARFFGEEVRPAPSPPPPETWETPRRADDRQGFTLVETMVALVIFTVGVTGLMGTSMLATRMIAHSQQTSIGVTFAKRTLDSLRVAGCAAPLSGSATLKRGGTAIDSLSWTFTARPSTTGIGPAAQSVRVIVKSMVGPSHWRTGMYETEVSCLF